VARRRRRVRVGNILPPLLVALALLAAWQLYVTTSGVNVEVLPGPLRIAAQGWDNRSTLWTNTIPTLEETLWGFAFSIAVAWVLAIVCDFWSLCRRGLEPLLVASQTIPIVAIAPLFIIWFGFSMLPKILIVALVTFFPVTVSLLQGFRTTPAEASNLLRSMGANRWQEFRRVRVPTALPFFFSGVRIAITYAVVGAIFGEFVGAESGLGIYMEISKNARRTDLVLAAVAVSAVISLALYFAVALIERVATPWSAGPKSSQEKR
jgi:ABC-type nitrate/sulfonate/bicarbonate transport system permease component